MDSGTTINLFGNPNMITNRKKLEMPTNFLTNAGSKIVGEMIANVLIMNEMTKKYRVSFDSGYENAFRVHIGNNIVKFLAWWKDLS